MKITYYFDYWFKEDREVKWEYEPTFDNKTVFAFLNDKYSLEEIKAELEDDNLKDCKTLEDCAKYIIDNYDDRDIYELDEDWFDDWFEPDAQEDFDKHFDPSNEWDDYWCYNW